MKPLLKTILALALTTALVAAISFYCFRLGAPAAHDHDADSLTWLRVEFRLSNEQLARIEKLHDEYHVVCDAHCAEILRSRAEVRNLRAQAASAERIALAEAEVARIDAECRRSLDAHVRAVADLIGGDQGRRYLEAILPRLEHFDHRGPPDLELKTRHAHDARDAH